MKGFLIVAAVAMVLFCFTAQTDAKCFGGQCQIGARVGAFLDRAPVRTAIKTVLEKQPVRTRIKAVLERQSVRTALRRVAKRRPLQRLVCRLRCRK